MTYFDTAYMLKCYVVLVASALLESLRETSRQADARRDP